MKYNFDEVVDRKNSNSIKWVAPRLEYGDEDILPVWIADMDFKVADEILNGLKGPIEHGILGYDINPDSFYEVIINWIYDKHNWKIEKEWITFVPGVVPAIGIAVRAFTEENDEALLQSPVYHPFYKILNNNNRVAVENHLVFDKNRYILDFDDMRSKISEKTKMAIFCSPHNPAGRVWTKEELEEYGRICLENNMVILSDEIHSDIIYKNHKHIPIASISRDLEMNTITFMAPSKTFNVAGLFASVAIIPNEAMKKAYNQALDTLSLNHANTFSVAGFEAAYKYGKEWLAEVLEYIEGNADFATEYIKKNIPEVVAYKPDGTFLMWLNFNNLGKTSDEVNELLVKKGKVLLNNGKDFGTGGDGYFRFNIACPRSVLEDALKRIALAVQGN